MTSSASKNGGFAGQQKPRLGLRFISGKYQGGEFPLIEGQDVVVGRSSDLDMVLVEELVSRRHAVIALGESGITIEDLGSTNGTFVNGERVQKANLKEGDRVLIGTSILKVITLTGDPEGSQTARRPNLGKVTERSVSKSRLGEEAPRMSGHLEEIPLPDLLQLFGTSKKSGVLVLSSQGREGRVVLDGGRIRYAQIEGPVLLPPLKAIYRLLEWRDGTFELEPPAEGAPANPIDVTAQEVLMEGIRQIDELNAIQHKLPSSESGVRLKLPLVPPLRELAPADLDVFQTALNTSSVGELFDACPSTDLDTAKSLLLLIERGYLEVE
jgi:pSer/pThr/pTyr-binding forkhead associated (FHA) protein